MSTERSVYAGLLVAAAFWALMSAIFLLASPYEGYQGRAWFWGAVFVASSLVADCCFWELLGGGV